MAALNHVCMWSEHGWVRVTAEQVSRCHPGGVVSAYSGIFMCALCHQYVTLAGGDKQVRHFRHRAYEADKNCPERTFGSQYTAIYKGEHELPLKLTFHDKSFHLELGLLYVPSDILEEEETKTLTIKLSDDIRYTYSFDRLKADSITYLSVGSVPFEKYEILSSEQLLSYWPRNVKGISRKGSLFDMRTGKKLTLDSDVCVQKKYYLLTTQLYDYIPGVSVSLKHRIYSDSETWQLYLVEANELNEDAADFFLSLHYWLTDSPLRERPLWPLHIRTPYVVKHPDDYLIIHLSGKREKKLSAFPSARIRSLKCSKNGQISRIECNGRQQIIASGQANVLQYLYFWKEPLEQTGKQPKFQVQDIHGKDINSGQHNDLPAREIIKVLLPYDGKAIIRRDGIIVDKRTIKAQLYCSIDHITFGEEIEVYIGLDNVWSASFDRIKDNTYSLEDALLISALDSFQGNEIPVPHSFGSLVKKLDNYPQTRKWLYRAIRRGAAPEKAIKYLKNKLSTKEE